MQSLFIPVENLTTVINKEVKEKHYHAGYSNNNRKVAVWYTLCIISIQTSAYKPFQSSGG